MTNDQLTTLIIDRADTIIKLLEAIDKNTQPHSAPVNRRIEQMVRSEEKFRQALKDNFDLTEAEMDKAIAESAGSPLLNGFMQGMTSNSVTIETTTTTSAPVSVGKDAQ